MTKGWKWLATRHPGQRRIRRTSVTLLMMSVQKPRKPFMMNPAIMHLISDIPDPAAYFASDCTRCAATKEKAAWERVNVRGGIR